MKSLILIFKNIQKLHIIATKTLSLTMPRLSPEVNLSLMDMKVSIKVKTKDKFENKFDENINNENEVGRVEFSPPQKVFNPICDWYWFP